MSGHFPTGFATSAPSPAGRVLALLERVQERPGLTADQLAAELGVGERTVRRYVTTLQDLGIPVVARRGRVGGYHLEAGFRMPPLMLSTDEAVALTLTMAVLAGRDGTTGPADAALAKLRRALPRAVAERVDDVLSAVVPPEHSDRLAAGAAPDPSLLATLAAGVVGERVCRIRHRPSGGPGEDTVRAVNPYGVAVVRGRLYLHGWCHLRRARRTFRVDRITSVQLLPDTFHAPAGLDVADAVATSLATTWDGWSVSVVLDAPLAAVEAAFPRYVGVPEEVDATTTRLRLTTRNLDATVLRLSDHAFAMRVEEPAALREAFARRAAWMTRVAGPSTVDGTNGASGVSDPA
ncbi:helix-turn-helix transcriptional regulator [Nocardioides rubriscoriae]|uniref:helix-turn-helix transcriptional regulator n=1 Tax=Nocardioides rubriscoriae TaxID=642762 RepID=UPI001478598D|nr:YafY family protein [Nocardioides rubriscoriae]